jgi:hypothetical protein
VGPQCSTLPATGFTFYREHYVNVTQPSNTGAGGAQAGVYPDALIPFKNPFTGQPISGGTYPSAPFEVPPGQNQPVYVEIYVPDGTPAGVYAGAVTVTRDNSVKVADVPVSLTVLNIAIPKTSSLRSAFHDYDSDHSLGPARYYGYANQSPEHFSLAKALDENLIAHRVMPEGPIGTAFNADSRGHIVPNSQVDATITSLLTRPEYTDFALSFGEGYPFDKPTTQNRSLALTFLSDAFQWFSSRGLVDKVWLRPQDEPQTRADFQRVRDFADLIHDANPKYRVAITADFSQPEVQTYLYGHINMFIMGSWSWDPVATALRQAAGDKIWSYTGDVENYQNPSPFWQIDFPLLNYRIVPWISYRYGLEGMLYWTSHYWEQLQARGRSPWTDPCTDIEGGSCYNGEGMLIYPGKEVNYVIPQNAYGSASPVPVYGPIPSLRLKAIRDGMQDYELLQEIETDVGDEDIDVSVVVEVGCILSGTPIGVKQTRPGCDVFETPISQIVKKMTRQKNSWVSSSSGSLPSAWLDLADLYLGIFWRRLVFALKQLTNTRYRDDLRCIAASRRACKDSSAKI